MNIAVCEDTYTDALHLHQIITRYCRQELFTSSLTFYDNGKALLTSFEPGMFQIIFLDIYMDGLSGLDTARAIRETDQDCAIIFTSASTDYGAESYKVNASYYLVKPIAYPDFLSAMDRCHWLIEEHTQYIEIMVNHSLTQLFLKDIIYIEAFGKYCEIHMTDRILRSYMPLQELYKLVNDAFVRCHRSYIINLHHLTGIKNRDAVMSDDSEIPCSKTYFSHVLTAHHSYTTLINTCKV